MLSGHKLIITQISDKAILIPLPTVKKTLVRGSLGNRHRVRHHIPMDKPGNTVLSGTHPTPHILTANKLSTSSDSCCFHSSCHTSATNEGYPGLGIFCPVHCPHQGYPKPQALPSPSPFLYPSPLWQDVVENWKHKR